MAEQATENKYDDERKCENENSSAEEMLDLLENINIDPVQIWYGTGGWLPGPIELSEWREKLIAEKIDINDKLEESVQKLCDLIQNDLSIHRLVNQMLQQAKSLSPKFGMTIEIFLAGINLLIQNPIIWTPKGLVGVPLAGWFAGVDATLAGQTLFRYPAWNKCIKDILCTYNKFLNTQESWPTKDNTWLTDKALQPDYWGPLDLWHKEEECYPYWKSWNAWFGRKFADRHKSRPLAGKGNPNIITSTNDGVEFRWRSDIKLCDTFWLKNMSYSLIDIFGGIDDCESYAKCFVGGSIFQTFLNPFNYHNWWSPVSGKIKEVCVIPGYFYSKLVLPDIDGSTTASCPYLTQVNTRGIVIIDTSGPGLANIGYVCCIPIGMCEVSSIEYEERIKKGSTIIKGELLGKFQFGGSSFAIIFENTLKYDKLLTFMAEKNLKTGGKYFPMNAPAPSVTGNDKSIVVNVGQQIAVVTDLPTNNKSVLKE